MATYVHGHGYMCVRVVFLCVYNKWSSSTPYYGGGDNLKMKLRSCERNGIASRHAAAFSNNVHSEQHLTQYNKKKEDMLSRTSSGMCACARHVALLKTSGTRQSAVRYSPECVYQLQLFPSPGGTLYTVYSTAFTLLQIPRGRRLSCLPHRLRFTQAPLNLRFVCVTRARSLFGVFCH